MSHKEESARDRIVGATIACLEREGMHGLTVRSIAQEAGVNVAAVNYYFGSKSRLIEETLERTRRQQMWEAVDELQGAIDANGGDVRAGLAAFLDEFTGNMIQWPRLIEAQFHEILARQDYDVPVAEESNQFARAFLEKLDAALPPGDELDRKLSVVQLWSCLVLLGMLPRLFEPFLGASVHDPETRRRYAARLAGHFCGER